MAEQVTPHREEDILTVYRPALDKAPDRDDFAQQRFVRPATPYLLAPYLISKAAPDAESAPARNISPESSAEGVDRPSGNDRRQWLPEKVCHIPRIETPRLQFKPLQEWRGTVTEIREFEFDAELRDQTDPSRPREVATFNLDEVSEGDQRLLVVGAVFYWCIGYELTASRQRKLVSTIIFRRLPGWTKTEIEAVRRKAAEIEELLGIETALRKAT